MTGELAAPRQESQAGGGVLNLIAGARLVVSRQQVLLRRPRRKPNRHE